MRLMSTRAVRTSERRSNAETVFEGGRYGYVRDRWATVARIRTAAKRLLHNGLDWVQFRLGRDVVASDLRDNGSTSTETFMRCDPPPTITPRIGQTSS